MAKEFNFDSTLNIKVAEKAVVSKLDILSDGRIKVLLVYLASDDSFIDDKEVIVTKVQADNFFNNFSAAGGGLNAFIEDILDGMETLGELPSGSVSDV